MISNVKDAKINLDGSADGCNENASVCVTCGKEMPRIWDTVCKACGATSCYAHSWTDQQGKFWYCAKCRPADGINADSPEYKTLTPDSKGKI